VLFQAGWAYNDVFDTKKGGLIKNSAIPEPGSAIQSDGLNIYVGMIFIVVIIIAISVNRKTRGKKRGVVY
jgi:hypothetical protein